MHAHTLIHTHTLSLPLSCSLSEVSPLLSHTFSFWDSHFIPLSLSILLALLNITLSLYFRVSPLFSLSLSQALTHTLLLSLCATMLEYWSFWVWDQGPHLFLSLTHLTLALSHTLPLALSLSMCVTMLEYWSFWVWDQGPWLCLSHTLSLALTLCVLLCRCIKVLEFEIRVPASVCHTLSCSNSMCVTMLVY